MPARHRPARAFAAQSGRRQNARGVADAGRTAARGRHLARSPQREQRPRPRRRPDARRLLGRDARRPQSALDMDAAELLVACTVLVGPDRALGKAVEAGWGEAIGRVLPYLQRAALTPHLRDLARSHELGLDELRKEAAQATGQEVPELIPLRRMRARDLALTAMVAVAAYLLITQLAKIGFGTIADELRH